MYKALSSANVLAEDVSARSLLVKNDSALSYDKSQLDITFTCVEKDLQSLCTYDGNVG